MIANSRAWLALISALTTFTAACASSRGSTPSAARDTIEPPRLLTRGVVPELNISGPSPSGRPVARMQIEVLVDSQGRPDMKTLKVSGLGAAENRTAIERWIERVTFRPAMRNGQPVSGVFKTSIEVRVRVQRM